MIIYKTTNLINGKIYIGQYSGKNENYLGSGKYFLRALKKYGKKNFTREILEECNFKEQLDNREKYWIEELHARNIEIGYNIAKGGQTGFIKGSTHSEESINKMKRFGPDNHFYGKKHTEESKQKMKEHQPDKTGENNPMYGKTFSEESKKLMSEAKIGKYEGENNPNYGKTHKGEWILSEETKQKMRKPKSEETKQRMKEAWIKRKEKLNKDNND